MVVVTLATRILLTPSLPPNPFRSVSNGKSRNKTTEIVPQTTKSWKIKTIVASSSSSVVGSFNQTVGEQVLPVRECLENETKSKGKKRVFFLDVNPLCYAGNKPSLQSFGHWVSLFFSQVCLTDPVIAVFDGENCNEKRRQLLPSYKAHRRKFFPRPTTSKKYVRSQFGGSQQLIMDVLRKCNVPVLKVKGNEADDVVATLVEQVLKRGYRVVIASPDKDFKQLISENVQIVMPLAELDRWSFYTLKHYIAQYNCDPHSDLSLRCIMGDEVDGVPGIQHLVPGFGRRTALKLLKKHGSLENLLNAASVRTVGKQYAQEALTKYADYLRRNYEVLALRRDVDIHLQEEWLVKRDTRNDASVLSNFFRLLEETDKPTNASRTNFSNG
ncbi:hypothetical protein F3Y22_tig00112498pilonHSYRG00296 [Hibiscus syriacus]|uniref:5'-3' exonuclease domain-containing protein n=1 Tax=Hibiscus syriacus TaxID=106335 RepID=A0A6A2WX91_HIBSY|nr:5'-3' exonuclease-like [Hibiscus syriacus]KAE8666522.1 hypothetical protein F3Y22_tig00112498pilonHSYRG00296 [Hibiscus syriacus]